MSSGPTGDYGYAVHELLSYLRDKGQIWSAAQLASIIAVNDYITRRYGVELGLGKLVQDWVRLSVIEAARYETVAQRNVEKVAKISAQVNYVEEQGTRTKFLPLGRRSKNQ
ncbi:MAG: hypothetical protein GSR84_03175 [Desulfurococcales archaeon]|nr:hypothetical protein [Desulfurococcales archaeon]